MKLKAFKLFILLFTIACSHAQVSISGTVKDNEGNALGEVEIYNLTTNSFTKTKADGTFLLEKCFVGDNKLTFYGFGFRVKEIVQNVQENTSITITLEELSNTLSEVVLIQEKEKVFVMGTGDPRCGYSALYAQGQQTWSRLVEMGELCNLLILCWLLCSRQGQGIPRWRKEMCKRCE